ncbi:gastrula zinc finger protein XlCGF46.1 [Amyelois transitella]|uniref:gastrula zinc finger protein XlCGF46.1 n=1 Tax=Amyelois transitella TaxID=680683 RepID=UPI00298F5B93|nr:gastrula zinc finger protein XlCGF46.1 [Amyelois transitella]
MDSNSIAINTDIYSYEYFLQEDVCRLCWCKKAERELMWKIINTQSLTKDALFDKIQDCLDVDLTQLFFPNRACLSCCDKIEKFYDFKTECKEKDRKLHQIIKQKNDNLDSVVKIEKVEFSNLEFTKTDLIDDVENFLDCFNSEKNSDVDSMCQNSSSERPKIKKANYRQKKSPTYCKKCRFDLRTKDEFSKHNEKCHGIEVNGFYKCFGCEKRFKSGKTRRAHEVTFCKGLKDGYKCYLCERFLPSRSIYDVHLRDHRESSFVNLPEHLFRCSKCSQLFKTKECLRAHVAEQCAKKFVCETCGRVFTRHDYLHKHKLTHTGTKQHVCPHCGFRTTQRSSLTVHIRKHTGERPYSCDICPQRCISSSNLQAHLRRHGGLKRYQCNICNKKFGYKISLEEHVASAHERSQSFACEHCSATYTRRRGLKRHLAAKHGKHVKESDITATDNQDKTKKDELKSLEVKQSDFVISDSFNV